MKNPKITIIDYGIGLNVVIFPGSNLGRGCEVGANSVVRSSFEEFLVIGGIPAKLIKYR